MYKNSLIVASIKDAVSMSDIVDKYCADRRQKDRIPCPIHNGKDANLWFSDTGYYCFVCGSGGDEISFVQHLFGLSFSDTLRKISDDFGLPLPFDRKMTLKEQTKLKAIKSAHDASVAEKTAATATLRQRYDELWSIWARYDIAIRTKRPNLYDEAPDAEWAEAIKNIAHIEFQIDSLRG